MPFPSPGALSDPGIEPVSPALAGGFFFFLTAEPPGKSLPHQSVEMITGLTSEGCCEEELRRHMVSAQGVLIVIIILVPCGSCSRVGIASFPSRQPSKKVGTPICLHCYFLSE